MNSLDRLELLMASALEKATIEQLKSVSLALVPVLPDIVAGLRDVIVDPQSTATARLRALEMIMGAWGRCLKADLQSQKAEVNRNRHRARVAMAAAARAKAKADERKAAVFAAKEQRKIARALKQAKKEKDGKDIVTGNH